ncbi:MAG: DUF998 domain-containing protein [Desulfurococcales archaeon]|nr:DUF998 domain-containing protein [Desulfurococcales archaeon]
MRGCMLALAAMILAWIVIGASWMLNPWFDFWGDAFSDLGVPGQARYPWVYNYGLRATGMLLVGYSIYLYRWAKYKPEALASGLMAVAGIFLALIGVYPGGTRPHVFVSTWFFIQIDMALIPLMYSLWRNRGFKPAAWGLALALLAFPVFLAVEALVGWPSVAAGEAYGILVIDVAVVIALAYQCRE